MTDTCGATKRDGSEEPCELPAGWGTDHQGEGQCKLHGGCGGLPEGEEGAPEENVNALTHGLYALPEHLKKHFSEEQQDRYTAYFEALCSRYERVHLREPDEFAKDRLSRIAIECVKERIADEWLSEQADDTGHLLIESYVIGQDEDGAPVEVEAENRILKELTALKRENRLTLKDMGLLRDPETKQAEAEQNLVEVLKNADG